MTPSPEALPPTPDPFDKYESMGAYHWREADPRSRHYNPPLAARYQIVIESVHSLGPARRLLDVGCGDGYLMSRLSPLAEAVVGIDSESRGVALAGRRLEGFRNCTVLRGSGYGLPFGGGGFDLVTCTDVIEHLRKPEQVLSEIHRVLRPGGELVLTTPRWRPDRQWDHRHVKEYRAEELMQLLAPFFGAVRLCFFWPTLWSRLYATRLGWRLIPYFSRWFFNPFMVQGEAAECFGQLLAIGTRSLRSGANSSRDVRR